MIMNLDGEYPYMEMREKGEIVEYDGYHKPRKGRVFRCNCRLITDKGAYRDETIKLEDGTKIHYYHQHPIVVKSPEYGLMISDCGYRTRTTKERINRYLLEDMRLYQKDYDWYLEVDGETIEFDGFYALEPEELVIREL